MRLIYLAPIVLLGAVAAARAEEKSDTQSYCVNAKADFYPYTPGQNCKHGYQLAPGNCRLATGKVVAALKDECTRMTGSVQLPFPAVLAPDVPRPAADPREKD